MLATDWNVVALDCVAAIICLGMTGGSPDADVSGWEAGLLATGCCTAGMDSTALLAIPGMLVCVRLLLGDVRAAMNISKLASSMGVDLAASSTAGVPAGAPRPKRLWPAVVLGSRRTR